MKWIRKGVAVLIAQIFLSVDGQLVTQYLSRTEAHKSQRFRSRTEAVEQYFFERRDEAPSRVFLVSQDLDPYDALLIHYVIRPNSMPWRWYFTENESLAQEMEWEDGETYKAILKTTPELWQNEILQEYDYVITFAVDEYFLGNYTDNVSESVEQGNIAVLWRVDREKGTLVRLTENG